MLPATAKGGKLVVGVEHRELVLAILKEQSEQFFLFSVLIFNKSSLNKISSQIHLKFCHS
jgi:hypothetical protein